MIWLLSACVSSPVIPGDIGLEVRHTAGVGEAALGDAWLRGRTTGDWGFAVVGFQALGLVRAGGVYSRDELSAALVEDYGFIADPDDPAGPPVGVAIDDGVIQFTCLSCHADRIAGQVVIGGSNGSVDWESLAADLVVVASLASVPVPFTLEGFTGAPGTHDAWGLGFELSDGPSTVHTDFGFQQSPAWWSRRFKERLYLDGSGTTDGRRTMAAMYLGYGATLDDIVRMEPSLDDAWASMVRLDVPAWSLTELDPAQWEHGEALFVDQCASCHGHYSGDVARTFPDQIARVGTDPLRHEQMRQTEVDFLNGSWFGEDAPFEDTDGYLAPVLHGVWATAPYLHNGSVPTLWGVLHSPSRPSAWQRTGHEAEHYDAERVGLVVRTFDDPSEADGPVYDTSIRGLGNGGHTMGDLLTDEERSALLEYLKSL